MFRRIFWLIVGAGFGFGVSFWLMRFFRHTADRYRPQRISNELSGALTSFGKDLRAAVHEGRLAMHERETELKSELARRGPR